MDRKRKRIYLASPTMHEWEQKYVQEAFDTNWIAPVGPHVSALEEEMAAYTGAGYAAALSAGTAAIHLAVKLLGIKEGDKVLCSSLTFSASCNPVCYEKAVPVFVDVRRDTYNMDVLSLEKAIERVETEGRLKPRAVIAVDLFGLPADYDAIRSVCDRSGLLLIEDGAQGCGGRMGERKCCSFGDSSTTSFFPAKPFSTVM